MKKHLITLVAFLIGSSLYAQISFEKTITLTEASTQSKGNVVTQTSDQGYAIAADDNTGGNHGVLIRTDAYGDTLWTRSLNGIFFDISETPDGGFILTGTVNGSLLMLKTSPEGETQWENTAGNDATGYSVCVTNDGGYCFAGVADHSQYKVSRMFLVRTDGEGTVLWTQHYGETNRWYLGRSMIQSADGGFIICGYEQTTPYGGESSLCLVKAKSGGTQEWIKTYQRTFTENGRVVMPAGDGGYLAVGTTLTSPYQSFFLVRTDQFGDTLWTKTIAARQPGSAFSATNVACGGYLLAATINDSVSNSNNIQLIRIDNGGETFWTKQVGSQNHEYVFSLKQTQDEGFIICGGIWESGPQTMKTYLVKTDSLGYYPWVSVPEEDQRNSPVVFPNPVHDIFTVVVPGNTLTLEICNIQGFAVEKAQTAGVHAGKNMVNLSGYAPGIYLVKVRTKEHLVTRKIVKL